ncbi:hypothetical protein ACRE_068600 [Hapsidospora chrysogenum ATCC 11550]|uniref:Uncharacterized protein n=1 Tax=Hapsidospora chrysogenum (strain ATCC 11550 / CBS 779.69 / DSM 880 / IAM 14645 / JCM 23072 / IMI 49137) TaxID=857340 RepID=A0A086SZ65_HAPC1|nr:hypothetical protein ACRE_068600 [Hapsidospora chrysogenum ATCC 11550]
MWIPHGYLPTPEHSPRTKVIFVLQQPLDDSPVDLSRIRKRLDEANDQMHISMGRFLVEP